MKYRECKPYQNPNGYKFQKVDMKRLEKKEFLKASRQYPRNFNYKNVAGMTLYKGKEHIVLTHSYCDGFYFDGQDYGTKICRVWIYDVDTRSQSIANLDFDLVEISRKDFDGYQWLILTRREIFGDDPVDNGFLGEWFAMNVRDPVPSQFSVEEINTLINYIEDASNAMMDAIGAKEALERGWILRKEHYPEGGWRQ